MGIVLKGKELNEVYTSKLKTMVDKRRNEGKNIPCLTAVLVGNDGGSLFYVNYQKKMCDKVGIKYNLIHLEEDTNEEKLLKTIEKLNEYREVHGIILQLPLPKGLNPKKITSCISENKDVDGLTDINIGKLFKGEDCFIPCTPRSVLEIVKSTGEKIEGKNAVIVGRSNIVGKPAAMLFLQENATVTIAHSRTESLNEVTNKADILVACVGVPGLITKEYVKEGAIVIDVGTSNVDGKMKGDVDFDGVIEKAAYVTPVPGGVGSVTTMMLIQNTVEAAERFDK
ncbi:tetrahydrofolate dehydrogenase/cyclohydrolase catalytic domain-containing protein [Hathewaya histolytica]|uniref:Bifunctional protein FolD n=1 Tax=Hathewaya histolytica TaxID=1498 RepID=A0A4U9RD01_HATHI|nr:tetrahydrofolate dehydrogenase/cyclohydrolase catalytic domain-containing protein [Hathewaya histolytica]VTQ88173.1 methylenetetrahydrofolate dehydrogenase [Hathewaya histolytica]